MFGYHEGVPRAKLEVPEKLFAALADRTRLRLLNLIGDREVCVCYFVQVLALPQPTISRHLAFLRRSGVVVARRQGKWMHYRLAAPAHGAVRALLRQTLGWLGEQPEMRRDRNRLKRASWDARQIAQLRHAPAPQPAEERK